MKSAKQIDAAIQKLLRQKELLLSRQRMPIIREVLAKMGKHGITVEDLQAVVKRGRPGRAKVGRAVKSPSVIRNPVVPKYLHPDTGATWSGRGRPPRWVAEAEAAGTSREKFAIEANS